MNSRVERAASFVGRQLGNLSLIFGGWLWGAHSALWAAVWWGGSIVVAFAVLGVIAYIEDRQSEIPA